MGYSLILYSEKQMHYHTEERLSQLEQYFENQVFTPEYIETVGPALANSGTKIVLYDGHGQLIYPKDKQYDIFFDYISQEELTAVKAGKDLKAKPYALGFDADQQTDSLVKLLKVDYGSGGVYEGILLIGSKATLATTVIEASRHDLIISLLIVVLITVLIATIFSLFLNYRILGLRFAARKIAQGEYHYRLKLRGDDELNALAEDFNYMAEALEQSDREVARQEKLRQKFMLDIAHEMRTPLTTMNGIVEGLRYHVIPEDRRDRCFELLDGETKRLTRLVEQSMDIEKIRSNEIYLNQVIFAIKPLLDDTIMQLNDRAVAKGNQLILDCDNAVKIYADRDRLRQIIFNITNNAIQFTENGKIHLKAREEAGQTHIIITDTGIGMAKEDIENIWERFYKVDESRKANHFGESGLGLSIVKQLVNAHEASIEVTSELGEGSCFSLIFPRYDQMADSEREAIMNDLRQNAQKVKKKDNKAIKKPKKRKGKFGRWLERTNEKLQGTMVIDLNDVSDERSQNEAKGEDNLVKTTKSEQKVK